jgi:hypothetical protein
MNAEVTATTLLFAGVGSVFRVSSSAFSEGGTDLEKLLGSGWGFGTAGSPAKLVVVELLTAASVSSVGISPQRYADLGFC